jgi:hypothetical protein
VSQIKLPQSGYVFICGDDAFMEAVAEMFNEIHDKGHRDHDEDRRR